MLTNRADSKLFFELYIDFCTPESVVVLCGIVNSGHQNRKSPVVGIHPGKVLMKRAKIQGLVSLFSARIVRNNSFRVWNDFHTNWRRYILDSIAILSRQTSVRVDENSTKQKQPKTGASASATKVRYDCDCLIDLIRS